MSKKRAVKKIQNLLELSRFGILATQTEEGNPYTNLIGIMPWDDFKSLIFFTPSNTRKYSNLKRNPSVSVFVDSTKNSGQDIAEALGLNISGEAEEIPESGESEKIRSDFIKRNPAMKEFVESPSVAMFRIMVRTYFFVERFQQVTEIHIDQWKK